MRSAGSRTPLEASRHRTFQNIAISRFRDLLFVKIPWVSPIVSSNLYLPLWRYAVFSCHPYWCFTLHANSFLVRHRFLLYFCTFQRVSYGVDQTHMNIYICTNAADIAIWSLQRVGCMQSGSRASHTCSLLSTTCPSDSVVLSWLGNKEECKNGCVLRDYSPAVRDHLFRFTFMIG